MKASTLFFLSICVLNGLSCQELTGERELDSDERFQIANDETFIAYKKVVAESGMYIALNQCDLEAIHDVRNSYPYARTMRQIPEQAYADIRGGILYRDIRIRLDSLIDEVQRKFQFFTLPEEERREINRIYSTGIGAQIENEIREKVFHYHQSKKQ
jgi:hypothetical protein